MVLKFFCDTVTLVDHLCDSTVNRTHRLRVWHFHADMNVVFRGTVRQIRRLQQFNLNYARKEIGFNFMTTLHISFMPCLIQNRNKIIKCSNIN